MGKSFKGSNMKEVVLKFKLIFTCLLSLVSPAIGEELTLKYGANIVDLNRDGVNDVIVKSRWQNFNAHSFDKYLIMIHNQERGVHYEVPLGNKFDYVFRNKEGADCFIQEFKFELSENGLLVTKYTRNYGESMMSKMPVKVTVYKLTDSIKEYEIASVGLPQFYLKELGKEYTKEKYCDVREYMKKK